MSVSETISEDNQNGSTPNLKIDKEDVDDYDNVGEDDKEDENEDDLSLGGSEGSGDEMDLGIADDENDDGVNENSYNLDKVKDTDQCGEPAMKKQRKEGPAGWADAMARILGSEKSIMSKAKKDKDVVIKSKVEKKKVEVEVIGEDCVTKKKLIEGEEEKAEKAGDIQNTKASKKATAELKATNFGRTKPHLLERQFERSLQRIATRGVIQLFNAVSKHQKETKDKIKKDGKSEFKKDAILKSVSKGDFIDLLKDEKISKPIRAKKEEIKTGNLLPATESTWKILKDDFMMTKGKSMKDWDKESDSDE